MKTLFITLILVSTSLLAAQDTKINNTIDAYAEAHNFNGTILLKKENKTLHFRSYGLANREFNVPNQNDTKYKIASITKLFTSVLIYQLVENDRIKLNKFITDYLPEYKGEGGNEVTIQQLLTSTSGIQNLEQDGDSVYEKRLTTDEILTQYCSGPLQFVPGSKFQYNNADYIILGKILEKIHGIPFHLILKQQLLEPLNMKSSGGFNYTVVNNLAQCYWRNEETNTIEKDIPYFIENYFSAGAMFSSASDLNLFSHALFSERILKQTTLDLLLNTEKNVKDSEGYASGLWSFSFETDGTVNSIASRPGNIWGAEAMLQRFIEKKISIIILSNGMETSNTWELLRMIQPYLN